MMNTKKLSYLSILFLSLLFLQASPVNAHAPSSVTLDYDFGTQVLTVEVDHGVGDVNTHYIIQIVVEKNSVEFTTRDYTVQDTTSGMSDTFDVPAVDGDVLRVIATCNAIGEHVNTIAVSDPSITITTTTTGPYNDSFGKDNMLLYKYRGKDPNHRDNVGLRKAMQRQVPLVYFHGVVPGKYLAVWPIFIIEDYPDLLTFKVAADTLSYIGENTLSEDSNYRRKYITSEVKIRLHQRGFRERVLRAYREQCACCKLRHAELLDAAHIIPDSSPEGEPLVKNGISLCKLHHAAFDSHFLGIRPDYIIEINRDILKEKDGPMLLHGLVNLNNKRINLPRERKSYPDPSLLDIKYQEFISVS